MAVEVIETRQRGYPRKAWWNAVKEDMKS